MRCFTQTFDTSFYDADTAPDFVKTAAADDDRRIKGLSDACFGLIVIEKFATSRMFPIDSSAHVWKSGQYLNENLGGMPKTAAAIAARNICAAADVRGVQVPEQLHKLATAAGGIQTRYYEKRDGDFTVGYPEDEGLGKTAAITVDGKVMPIRNTYELGAAEDYFDRNHTKMASAIKYRIANLIAAQRAALATSKTAETANVCGRSPEVTRISRLNAFNPGLRAALYKRAAMAPDLDSWNGYVKLAENLKVASFSGPATLIDAIENLDYKAGINASYGAWVKDPIDTVLYKSAIHAKSAAEAATMTDADDERQSESISVLMGRPISVKEVKRSANDGALRRVLGDGLAGQLASNPDAVLAALPDDMKSVIAQHLAKG